MKKIINSFKSYLFGPYHSLWVEDKRNIKDPNNFVMVLSLIFSILFFMIFRTGIDVFFKDIGYSFANILSGSNIVFFVLLVASILLLVFNQLFVSKKKKIVTLGNSIALVAFVYVLYFVISVSKSVNVKNNNWLLWLIMVIPSFVLLFSLLVRVVRLVISYTQITPQITEARFADYTFKVRYQKRIFRRLGAYLKENWGQVLVVIALTSLALGVLFPLVILLLRSIKDAYWDLAHPFDVPTKFTFDNYKVAWESIKDAFVNSLVTTIGVTVGTLICASLLAFTFIRFKFPGKNILFYAIIGLMMIPGILTLISRFQLVQQISLMDDGYGDWITRFKVFGGIILPGIAGYIPMAFMLLFTFFNALPKDLFEAADVDGAKDLSIFLKIVVPLSKPILSTIAIQTFVGEWNDYLWANLVHGNFDESATLPVMLQTMSQLADQGGLPYTVVFAGYVLSAIPLVLIFIVASKQFIEGLTSGAFKM